MSINYRIRWIGISLVLVSLIAGCATFVTRPVNGSLEQPDLLAKAIFAHGIGHPPSANEVELLVTGTATFRSLYQRLSRAKHSIYFSSYIFQSDETGTGIAKLLMRKARAGLDVKLYLDAWGSIYFSADLEKELKESGVQFVYFRPFEILRPYRHLLRNHRRIIIVDHESALTGGFAIQDAWADFYPDNEVADM